MHQDNKNPQSQRHLLRLVWSKALAVDESYHPDFIEDVTSFAMIGRDQE